MGLGAVRLGDFVRKICKKKKSGPFLTGCKITFINGRPSIRVGDKSVPGRALTGSKSKFVCGKAIVRLKDKVKCGRILRASKDTFVGD